MLIVIPKDFVIHENATKIHKIINEHTRQHGGKITDVLKNGFVQKIKNCDYIVEYNIFFDINVLLNELHRCEFCKNNNKNKRINIEQENNVCW